MLPQHTASEKAGFAITHDSNQRHTAAVAPPLYCCPADLHLSNMILPSYDPKSDLSSNASCTKKAEMEDLSSQSGTQCCSPIALPTRRVSAVVRIRPPAVKDIPSEALGIAVTSPTSLEVFVPETYNARAAPRSVAYHADCVLGSSTTQEQVWATVAPAMEGIMQLNGSCVTVMAFGATGTGKTYTMLGPENKPATPFSRLPSTSASANPRCGSVAKASKEQGILPRLCHALFDRLKKSPDWPEINIYVSNFEIYKEKFIDLFSENRSTAIKEKERFLHNETFYQGCSGALGNPKIQNLRFSPTPSASRLVPTAVSGTVKGLRWIRVASCNDLTQLLVFGARRRASRQTRFNKHSSRSHAVWQISIERCGGNARHLVGELQFIDLAGAERSSPGLQSNSAHSQEMAAINKSLCSLSQCIEHLAKRPDAYRPFRDSKLTRLLMDKLKGQGQLMMIFTASPFIQHYRASLLTLQLARTVLSSRFYTLPPISSLPVLLKNEKQQCTGSEGFSSESIDKGWRKPGLFWDQPLTAGTTEPLASGALQKRATCTPNAAALHEGCTTAGNRIASSAGNAWLPSASNASLRDIVRELWCENQALKQQLRKINSKLYKKRGTTTAETALEPPHQTSKLLSTGATPRYTERDATVVTANVLDNRTVSHQENGFKNVTPYAGQSGNAAPKVTAVLQQKPLTESLFRTQERSALPNEQPNYTCWGASTGFPDDLLASQKSWCPNPDTASETTASEKQSHLLGRQSTSSGSSVVSYKNQTFTTLQHSQSSKGLLTSPIIRALHAQEQYVTPHRDQSTMQARDQNQLSFIQSNATESLSRQQHSFPKATTHWSFNDAGRKNLMNITPSFNAAQPAEHIVSSPPTYTTMPFYTYKNLSQRATLTNNMPQQPTGFGFHQPNVGKLTPLFNPSPILDVHRASKTGYMTYTSCFSTLNQRVQSV